MLTERTNDQRRKEINPLNSELNPIRHLLALVGARHIVHVSRVRVKELSVCCVCVSAVFSIDCVELTF